MKFIISKAFLLFLGILLVIVKLAVVFDTGASLLTPSQWSLFVSLTGDVISLVMFLVLIGTVVYVLSSGLLENKS